MHSFAIGRRTCPALLSSLAAAALLLAPAAAIGDDAPPPFTSTPRIDGDAFVGSTLTAVAAWTGDPLPVARYAWLRCPATGTKCDTIPDADATQYVVTNADLGFRLGLLVQLRVKGEGQIAAARSVTTAVVVPAPVVTPPTTTPDPPPGSSDPPPPPPASDPAPQASSSESRTSFAEPVAPIVDVAARATLLRPFPVVRIRGYFKPGGVRVTLLSVNAPRSAQIAVRCVGRGCPVRALSLASAPARLRPFERFLPAGTVLQVRVTRQGSIGKYASFVIRARSAPLRTDRCLMPGRAQPAACPTL